MLSFQVVELARCFAPTKVRLSPDECRKARDNSESTAYWSWKNASCEKCGVWRIASPSKLQQWFGDLTPSGIAPLMEIWPEKYRSRMQARKACMLSNRRSGGSGGGEKAARVYPHEHATCSADWIRHMAWISDGPREVLTHLPWHRRTAWRPKVADVLRSVAAERLGGLTVAAQFTCPG